MITVGLISLGCAKNLVDSEVMLGVLRRRGFQISLSPETADVVVVNTCGFLQAAEEEGYATIREMGRLKRHGRLRRLVVAGCMVQRSADRISADLPEIDRILGLNDVERIAEACDLEDEGFSPDLGPALYMPTADSGRILATAGASAYLKISEGCDNPCAFCIIPAIRGNFRSRPIDSLVTEAMGLVDSGVSEINLIAQDSTSYGSDIGERGGLPDLLEALDRVDGIRWIRLLYAYPSKITSRLIDTIAECDRVCKYIDVPLQHASKRVLTRMRRGGSRESFMRLIERFRSSVPGISLRTTLIVGFPGETEHDVEELLGFVRDAEFDHLGVFTYSHEPGTAAHDLHDDLSVQEKEDRRDRVMTLQQEISRRRYASRVGTRETVLVEGAPEDHGAPHRARAAFQAPDIDGGVLIRSEENLPMGGYLDVDIVDAEPYDLIATPIPAGVRES